MRPSVSITVGISKFDGFEEDIFIVNKIIGRELALVKPECQFYLLNL